MSEVLSGGWSRWVLFDVKREYGTVQSLPFERAVASISPVPFDGETGTGQQRALIQSHVRKLKSEMRAGTFTPTPVSASLAPGHRANLVLRFDQTFVLDLKDKQLVQTDGGHRFAALATLEEELVGRLALLNDGAEKEEVARWLAQLRALPITVTVYFDGDSARDFVNLQLGRPVDASHMESLAAANQTFSDPSRSLAHTMARQLHKREGAPFHNNVKFDSRGNMSLPISTLCAKGASDLSTSLVGLAKVGEKWKKDDKFLVDAVVDSFQALKVEDERMANDGKISILDHGKVLTPIFDGGTKGSSTMLTGVGICLAYRLAKLGKDRADEAEKKWLVECALATLNRLTGGNFSGPLKRSMIGKFAKAYFADLPKNVSYHGGVPVELLLALSPSSFGLPPLPKEHRPKPVRKPRPKPKAKAPAKRSLRKKEEPVVEVVTVPEVVASEPEPAAASVETKAPTPVAVPNFGDPEPASDEGRNETAPWNRDLTA